MDIREIYVLNRALDGKDIFALPAFATLHMSNALLKTIKDNMVKAGLLETPDALSKKGAAITGQLDAYKNAKKYVRIGSVVVALLEEQAGILLQPDYGVKDGYTIQPVRMEHAAAELWESYPFLRQPATKEGPAAKMFFKECRERFSLQANNALWLSTLKKGQDIAVTNEVFFAAGGVPYAYNRDAKILQPTTSAAIKSILEERLAM